jgi:hypothetical protein
MPSGASSRCRSSANCKTIMSGSDLRQGQFIWDDVTSRRLLNMCFAGRDVDNDYPGDAPPQFACYSDDFQPVQH